MEIISYGKSVKAQKRIKEINKNLGHTESFKNGEFDIKDQSLNTDRRLKDIEDSLKPAILNSDISAPSWAVSKRLAKHNIKIDGLISGVKFNHSNLIFDTLSDYTGLSSWGSGITSSGDKIYNTSTTTASVITIPYESLTDIKRVSVSTRQGYSKNSNKIIKGSDFQSDNYKTNGNSVELKVTGSKSLPSNSSLIPAMTSNYSNGIEITASNNYSTDYPYQAFDGIATRNVPRSIWYATGTKGKGNYGHWIKLDFKYSPKTITKVSLLAFWVSGSKGSIRDFRISASNNDSTYKVLYSGTHPNNYEYFYSYSFSNVNSYRYYKIEIPNSYFGVNNVGITECKMYGSSEQNLYANDTESTTIVELGDNVREIKSFDVNCDVTQGNITLEVSKSDDGITFSTPTNVPLSGSYYSTGCKYIKIKVKLIPEKVNLNGVYYGVATPRLNSIKINFVEEVKSDPIKIFVSIDNGVIWNLIDQNDEFIFGSNSSGKKLKVKFDLKPGQELYAYSITWI